ISPNEFVKMYNIAQTLAAPVMAIAANSPIVFGKRLWHESRIALYQQSLDNRTTQDHMRERSPRVNFGKDWLKKSILEIYKEDITRFRVLISGDVEEDALQLIEEGKVPKLRALQVHNSTVYRWNRPCYGISDNGKPHLRIENRVLASGPTVLDEISNAVFWIGLMLGMADAFEDITQHISFADVSDNFGKAARFGIDSKFTWFHDEKISACDLIKSQLIPIAKNGLLSRGVNEQDVEKYLGVIYARADKHMNGARWQLRAFTDLKKKVSQDEALAVLTAATIKNQETNTPVHLWEMPKLSDLEEYKPSDLLVSEFMSTDLVTVQKDDLVELVADLMDWSNIRYIPVENAKGKFVGLLSASIMLKEILGNNLKGKEEDISVYQVMVKDPFTISPDTDILSAMHLMKEHGVGCLPVVKDEELIGIITEANFLAIANRLIERQK
ncbi:MAG: CBS domain-containing protein, partial [Bacteroidota bacterium]